MGYLDRLKKEKGLNSNSDAMPPLGPSKKTKRPLVRDIMPPEGQSEIRAMAGGRKEVRKDKGETQGAKEKGQAAPEIKPLSKPAPVPLLADQDIAIRTWEPAAARYSRWRRKIILSSAAILAAGGFILPTLIFPKFSIIIFPKIYTIALPALELSAETGVTAPNASARKIPAIRVEVEKTITQEYAASGTKFFRDRARGKVLLFNAFSSSPQTLVASTRLQDPSGKVFRLEKGIVIPGAEVQEGKIVPTSITAGVIADSPGEAYNIGPTEFRIPGFRGTPRYQGFYAKSEEKFSGGFEGEARIVLSEDLKRASENITKTLVEDLRSELEKRIPADPDFLAPSGGREIAVLSLDQPRPGERFDQFKVTAAGRGRLMAVRRSHIIETIGVILLPPMPELKFKLPSAQSNISVANGRLGPSPSELHFTVSGELDYWREIDAADLVKTLRTSTPKKAEAYLRGREEIGSFRLKRFPGWLWFIPQRESGLEIRVEAPA